MRTKSTETPEQRAERRRWAAQLKINEAAASEAAADEMIRRNIKQFGP